MPRTGVFTSPQGRQRIRDSYYAASEKEAGVAHLWHLQQLADIRFNPSHTIQDLPEVDFQSPDSPADAYRELFAHRYAQQVRHDDAKVHEQNRTVYRHLVLASDDDARRVRHMNLVPTANQVKSFDNIEQQTVHRTKHRERRQRVLAEENKRLLEHLIRVPPHVRTAKELDAWHHTVHQKRLVQLSKFRPAEEYAGARLLEGRSRDGAGKKRRNYGVAPPLVCGRPYPPPPLAEYARTAPSSLQPAGFATSFNGVLLHDAGDAAGSGRRLRRPDWQPLSATDIPLLHYGADQQLRGRSNNDNSSSTSRGGKGPSAQRELCPSPQNTSPGRIAILNVSTAGTDTTAKQLCSLRDQGAVVEGDEDDGGGGVDADRKKSRGRNVSDVRRVTAEEEGGVTQLWRHAVQGRYHSGCGTATSNYSSSRGRSAPSTRSYEAEEGRRRGSGGEEKAEVCASAPWTPAPQPQLSRSTPQRLRRRPQQRTSSAEPDADEQPQQQQRLSKKASRPSSSVRSPSDAIGAAVTAAPPNERGCAKGKDTQASSSSTRNDVDEAAALKELMEGWCRRSRASDTAYAPL
ncbi:hypothetical protein ABB37_02087 [Leptomonas pyrrhocoris]|uniref:Uncharacterized protein n=1 Tax=Leptomonas pyrrhocoris TaxID=157538 RepID=A0A0M9G775_LEPPY|nr:hypothetical protein ABB37_02087 [Leptomonas pyrrhocoris]XP_015662353.1 hypothetical protein ABB37_02087 [Leptomonas pyrrhocoris]XP_015662354.1 hypothetical protein ABB37_02087 [Leptomonas pyrrhocoris]XP_015662355.1 hypothetical protein ABB37_02087 [Leptomonas pyrrhocoris]XP_015662356.1 hypothetical protein ABB37_02087 [Leptomonas pyrrhocoris]KPA83913.1 hypothetical protein ABB37_02087 [Leptomonas pyrrhocoris]KPA83914.1 hypothetical protein ABB37_02087 [Leptomonas pyrrhocoris]KPA83915.1 h|eukprot:XP_015662352.1 hypothetical protein ABB37_02087 [Leptomonas pyrrhocoris]